MASQRKFIVAPLLLGASIAAFVVTGSVSIAQEACSNGIRVIKQLTHRKYHSAATLKAWKEWRNEHPNWKPKPRPIALPKGFFQVECNPISLAAVPPLTDLIAEDGAPATTGSPLFASSFQDLAVPGPQLVPKIDKKSEATTSEAGDNNAFTGYTPGLYGGYYGGGGGYYGGGYPTTPPPISPISPIASTPEPSSLLLLATGLCAVGGWVRRRGRDGR